MIQRNQIYISKRCQIFWHFLKILCYFQLEQDSDKADESIREVLLELGRRHFSYGANTSHMELLGRVFVESLQPLFNSDPEYEAMQKAWINFFRVIVFWLQTGFRFVQFKGNAKLIY